MTRAQFSTKAERALRHAPRLALHWASLAARGVGLAPRIGQLTHHRPIPLQLPAADASLGRPLDSPPMISIVTPNLDQGRFLERTLASVLDQRYPALEYIVRDGGSTDESSEVLARHAARLQKVVSEPDGGQAAALNRGFRSTRGEIMAWLNADDLLLPGALDFVARYFIEHPDVDVLYGHRVLIDSEDREIGRWILPEHDDETLRWADFVPQETLFWRRRAWDEIGGALDESYRFAIDWDLLLRFAGAGLTLVRVPRFLGAFRVHPEQKTHSWKDVGASEMSRLRTRELGRQPHPQQIHRKLWRYYLRHLWLHARYRMGFGLG